MTAAALDIVRGTSAVLFVAPHGARRPAVDAAAPPPNLRVNDVYTPELTRMLAARLGAGCIINAVHDRNALDLNRISQVRRRAPWFLAVLAQEIEAILARHAQAEIVFVHGWHVGQPKCDIGVGGVEAADQVAPVNGAALSVGQTYLRTRLAALRAACAHAGIAAPIGERYSGSHRNNLLQLFRGDNAGLDDPPAQRIARWVEEGRLNACQLELGIPLRWPGAWRDRFVEAVVAGFGDSGRVQDPTSKVQSSPPRTPRSAPNTGTALQFYDPVAGIGMFAGVGPMGPRSTGGRVLLFLGGQRVALFTGEDAGAGRRVVEPLVLESDGDAMRLQFTGPMLRLGDAATYLDLEAALAASSLVSAQLDIRFHPRHEAHGGGPRFGLIQGEIAVGSQQARVDCGGFANAGGLRAGSSGASTMLTAAFGSERGVAARVSERDGAMALQFGAAAEQVEAGHIAVSVAGDGYTPTALELRWPGKMPMQAGPLSRMAILRPAGGGYLRVTFGTARFRWGDLEGAGLYEHACPLGRVIAG